MTLDVEKVLNVSVEKQRKGDLEAAEAGYQRILLDNPLHGEALQLLGGLKLEQGDLEAARAILSKAIKSSPNDPVARINLAAALMKTGDDLGAHEQALAAVSLAPDHPVPWKQLALTAAKTGDVSSEARALERLLSWEQNNIQAATRLAVLLAQLDRAYDCERLVLALLRRDRMSEGTYRRLAMAARSLRRWKLLVLVAERWLAAWPNSAEARECLSNGHLEAGNVPAARAAYRPLLEGKSAAPQRSLAYGRLCLIAQDFADASAHLKRAVGMLPGSAEAAFAMARLYTFEGKLGEAEEECRRCLRLDPDFVQGYVQLVALRQGDVDDETVHQMERLWETSPLPKESLSSLAFALGDAFHKRSDYDRAFSFYCRGNEANYRIYEREGAIFNADRHNRRIDRLISDFADPVEQEEACDAVPFQPVFIVGMPRSGTTLVESILAAHSRVHGCGELLVGSHILEEYERARSGLTGNGPQAIIAQNAAIWIERFRKKFANEEGLEVVTDKLPINFLSLGILARLFPHAHFVHVRRAPLDTCFSIYRHSFPRAYDFSHRLADIGAFYRGYEKLMAHWESVLGAKLITLQYESLVGNPEIESRRIFDHIGLPWEERCLEFPKSQRPIATFSSVQVRQPISSSSIGVWSHYEAHLAPLRTVLGR